MLYAPTLYYSVQGSTFRVMACLSKGQVENMTTCPPSPVPYRCSVLEAAQQTTAHVLTIYLTEASTSWLLLTTCRPRPRMPTSLGPTRFLSTLYLPLEQINPRWSEIRSHLSVGQAGACPSLQSALLGQDDRRTIPTLHYSI